MDESESRKASKWWMTKGGCNPNKGGHAWEGKPLRKLMPSLSLLGSLVQTWRLKLRICGGQPGPVWSWWKRILCESGFCVKATSIYTAARSHFCVHRETSNNRNAKMRLCSGFSAELWTWMQGVAPTKLWRRTTDGGSGRSAGELHTPGLFRALFTQPSCAGMDAEITLQKPALFIYQRWGRKRGILVPERDHHHEKNHHQQ